jgi:hypothetical protein
MTQRGTSNDVVNGWQELQRVATAQAGALYTRLMDQRYNLGLTRYHPPVEA